MLVTLLLVLCSLLLRPARIRRTVTSTLVACLGGFAGDSAHRAVLLSLSSGQRCSVSWSAGPPLGLHHGRNGPEEQSRRYWWHVWQVLLVVLHLALCFFLSSGPRCSASWPVSTRRAVARGVQDNWIILEMTWYFFFGPLYLEVPCSSCLVEEYRVASFPGDDSRNGLRI